MNLYWKDHSGIERAHLAFDMFVEGNYRSSAKYLILVFLTFWILTSYMVPISLFVTMEIVKFWQVISHRRFKSAFPLLFCGSGLLSFCRFYRSQLDLKGLF